MYMTDRSIRIGSDPEVFVRRAGGDVIPVCDLIGGTKQYPKPLPINAGIAHSSDRGIFAYQEDGVALEFNTPAVVRAESFSWGIAHAVKECKRIAKARKLELVFAPYHTFKPAQLTHPNAQRIGCLLDQNAYLDGATRVPFNVSEFGNSRFAGGHVHLGYPVDNVPQKVMARYMDLFIGLPSIFVDKQGPRRQYYGGPGLYREKPYGLEYRTLSNYWVQDRYREKDYLIYFAQTVLDLGSLAATRPELLAQGYSSVPWDDVRECINTENTGLATEIHAYVTSVVRLPMRYWRELTGLPGKPTSDSLVFEVEPSEFEEEEVE